MEVDIRIADVLSNEYSDFLDFCLMADKKYRSELTKADFVAFRSQYGIPREEVENLQKFIASYEPLNDSVEEARPNITEDTKDVSECIDVLSLPDTNATSVVKEAEKDSAVISQGEYLYNKAKFYTKPYAVSKHTMGTDNDNKYQTNHLEFDSNIPLYQYFRVNWEPYLNMPILKSDFGVRAYNSLCSEQNKDGSVVVCKSIGDILQLSPFQLSCYKNMGKYSVKNIITVIEKILKADGTINETMKISNKVHISSKCRQEIFLMLCDEEYDISNLDDSETKAFSEYVATSDIIGKEIALKATCEVQAIISIRRMLNVFLIESQRF